jgi:hypothetical protein
LIEQRKPADRPGTASSSGSGDQASAVCSAPKGLAHSKLDSITLKFAMLAKGKKRKHKSTQANASRYEPS